MISHHHRVIFIHAPGTAGSSIETALVGKEWGLINEPKNSKHWSAQQWATEFPREWETYYKFTVARNPWDRVKSFERFQKELKPWSERPNISDIGKLPWIEEVAGAIPSVSELIHYDGSVDAWRYEDLNGFWQKHFAGIKLPFVNSGLGKTRAEFYNDCPKAIDLVATIYHDDIEAFGYNFHQ